MLVRVLKTAAVEFSKVTAKCTGWVWQKKTKIIIIQLDYRLKYDTPRKSHTTVVHFFLTEKNAKQLEISPKIEEARKNFYDFLNVGLCFILFFLQLRDSHER